MRPIAIGSSTVGSGGGRWPAVLVSVVAVAGGCGRIDFTSLTASDAAAGDTGTDGDVAVVPANRAFISSVRYPGDLGGPAGADARCQQLATAGGLDGEFVAFLRGVSRSSPISVLDGSRGWRTIDGRWVADDPGLIGSGQFLNMIDRDETGATVPDGVADRRVWSGDNGTDCSDWRTSDGTLGGDQHFITQWGRLSDGPIVCNATLRLFCFERGRTAVRVPPALDHRLVFVSAQAWTPSALGRADADALCTSEAVSAGLPGSFVALLPLEGESALTRIPNAASEIYQRVDGELVGVLASPSSYIMLDATGSPAIQRAWTGGSPDVAPVEHCTSWTTGSGAKTGRVGEPIYNDFTRYLTVVPEPCSAAHRLYCVNVP